MEKTLYLRLLSRFLKEENMYSIFTKNINKNLFSKEIKNKYTILSTDALYHIFAKNDMWYGANTNDLLKLRHFLSSREAKQKFNRIIFNILVNVGVNYIKEQGLLSNVEDNLYELNSEFSKFDKSKIFKQFLHLLYVNNYTPNYMINRAFTWNRTKEGALFWRTHHDNLEDAMYRMLTK